MILRGLVIVFLAFSFLSCVQPAKISAPVERTVASQQSQLWVDLNEFCLEVNSSNKIKCDPYQGVNVVMGTIEEYLKRSTRFDRLEQLSEICRRSSDLQGCNLSAGKDKILLILRQLAAATVPVSEKIDFWTDVEKFCAYFSRSQFPQCSRHHGIEKMANSLKNSCRGSLGCLKRAQEICQHYAGERSESSCQSQDVKEILISTSELHPLNQQGPASGNGLKAGDRRNGAR